MRLMHRDLKPDNIGLLADGTLVLFDFGLAKLWRPTSPEASRQELHAFTSQTGSARYMAPEVALEQPYNETADVYSWSLIMWQCASHNRPFDEMSLMAFHERVAKQGQRPPLRKTWPPALGSLLTAAWAADPLTRPTFAEIVPKLAALLAEVDPSLVVVPPCSPSCVVVAPSEPSPSAATPSS